MKSINILNKKLINQMKEIIYTVVAGFSIYFYIYFEYIFSVLLNCTPIICRTLKILIKKIKCFILTLILTHKDLIKSQKVN